MRVLRFERFSEKVYSLSTLCRAWNIKLVLLASLLPFPPFSRHPVKRSSQHAARPPAAALASMHGRESQASGAESSTGADAIPAADAISEGLLSLLAPMVGKCDSSIQRTLQSQAVLSQEIDRVALELQAFLAVSALPSFSQHAQRLADIRRRVAHANSTMVAVQARLTRMEELAGRLEREQGLTLQRRGGAG